MTQTSHLDLIIGTTNFGRGQTADSLVLNLASLRSCDVIIACEPGNFPAWSATMKRAMHPYSAHYAPRPGAEYHGGVLVLCLNSRLSTTRVDLPPPTSNTEFCCVALRKRSASSDPPVFAAVIGVYATNYRPHNELDTQANVQPIMNDLSAAVTAARTSLGADIPIILAGDFNARNTAFGDVATLVRGKMLHEWALDSGFQVLGTPSRPTKEPTSALDLVLVPAHIECSEPSTRTMINSDHRAVLVDIDSPSTYYYKRLLYCRNINETPFLAELERLPSRPTGTPHGQDFYLASVLETAILAGGGEWRRVRIYDRKPAPTVEQILSASFRSPWAAVALLRQRSPRIHDSITPDAMMTAFGSRGMQRSHDDAPLVRSPPSSFTPVSHAEVLEAAATLRRSASPDCNGVSAAILSVAVKSPAFVNAFAALLSESLRRGVVSPRWTTTSIVPIPKPGKPTDDVNSLRPIYVCDSLAKLADRIMERRAVAVYQPHPHQLGFRRGVPLDVLPLAILGICKKGQDRTGAQAVAASLQRQPTLFESLGLTPRASAPSSQPPRVSQSSVRRIYTLLIAVDFTNAFPGTPVSGIIRGYRDSNLPEDFVQYKIASLTQRQTRVAFRGKASAWDQIRDGTNQGAITGPLDYSASSAGLCTALENWRSSSLSTTREYGMVADDLSLVISGTRDDITLAARDGLMVITNWAELNGVTVSSKTCALLVSPQGANPPAWTGTELKCGGVSFKPKTTGHIRVLGYHIDSRLNMHAAVELVGSRHDTALHYLLPLLATLSLPDRRQVYDALAYSHVRRLVPILISLGIPPHSDVWQVLDKLVAIGCRVITGATATAHSASVILEAGFMPSYALGIHEASRLRAKIGATDICPSLKEHALNFLGNNDCVNSVPTQTIGVVVDRAATAPDQLTLAQSVFIRADPPLKPEEVSRLRKLQDSVEKDDVAEVLALKRKANAAVARQVKRIAAEGATVFCDGSVLQKSSELPRAGGAGAASLHRGRDFEMFSFTFKTCGSYACSFSAEVTAFNCGLKLVDDALASGALARKSVIAFVSDAQSMFKAMERGPLRQRDSRLDAVWKEILRLIETYDVAFALLFAFGHAGWEEADYIDELSRQTARHGANCDLMPWWRDAARVISAPLVEKAIGAAISNCFRARVDGGPDPIPSSWPLRTYRGFSKYDYRILCQLRTNACPRLGGHLIGQIVSCKRCCTPTVRGVPGKHSLVEHAFICPRARGARRTFRVRGAKDLWRRPRAALDYITHSFFEELREPSPEGPGPPRHFAPGVCAYGDF